MSGKLMQYDGKAFLVLLLPISFVIIFLVSTWKIWLIFLAIAICFNLWQQYRWDKWCQEVNPLFHQIIRENQGKITPMDLSIKGNLSGTVAKRYLDGKAAEFGASMLNSDNEDQCYYFITGSILGDILDSSESVKEDKVQSPSKKALSLLMPPTSSPEQEEEITESLPDLNHEEIKPPLAQQLVFGSLIQSELAKRLNVYSSTVYKRRNDPDFAEWSRARDPDGVAWSYSRRNKEFFPLEAEV
ncbi:hypothetical protein VB711_09510 [Cronbergia sp. UHCC 0137]|uniref:hypothetical protein n=1 Tax=Cronbergia sp. UHCC 0137 TaxID=3110239 RepID=UPI002B213681|nr:hypothetical protein [Cronbergia sp. UHCC 0137]MEA5618071.1 hypothetical protein [Cronbergia sp. UHCC 0137]